jgi:abequosyltransferase
MLPLLSICIPTYNRCRYLPETLDSILSQAPPEVEIVISDNASTDATTEVVSEYTEKYPNVRYSRVEINQGPDSNFLRVVSLATGRYCWLLSDDDTIKSGAIATILREILEDYEIYTFNETTCGNKLEPVREQQRLSVPNGRVVYDLSSPSDLSLFFERSDPVGGIPFGLISVLVFKKEVWDKVEVPEEMIGTAYVHVYVLLATKDYGARLKYLPQSLVMNRLNESYISTDPIRNFWVTADGYLVLADLLFRVKRYSAARKAFLDIASRIYTVRYIIALRIHCNNDHWSRVTVRLVDLGYNRIYLTFIGFGRMQLLAMRHIWRSIRSGCVFSKAKQRGRSEL